MTLYFPELKKPLNDTLFSGAKKPLNDTFIFRS